MKTKFDAAGKVMLEIKDLAYSLDRKCSALYNQRHLVESFLNSSSKDKVSLTKITILQKEIEFSLQNMKELAESLNKITEGSDVEQLNG